MQPPPPTSLSSIVAAATEPDNTGHIRTATHRVTTHYDGLALISADRIDDLLTADLTTVDVDTLTAAGAGLLQVRAAVADAETDTLTGAATMADAARRHSAANLYRQADTGRAQPDVNHTPLARIVAETACDLAAARLRITWPGIDPMLTRGADLLAARK